MNVGRRATLATLALTTLAIVGARRTLASRFPGDDASAPEAPSAPEAFPPADSPAPLDTLTFGDMASEKAHGLTATQSDVINGGLGESARRLLPSTSSDLMVNWEGGHLTFTLRVDPAQPNYLTVRLWGSDATENRLMLYVDGKQIGYRHLGDIDILDIGSSEPAYNGRFYYVTTPLPLEVTRVKSEIALEIRGTGRLWGYGTNFTQYQKPMTEPTRGIYRAYTHTGGCFVPPPEEKQGQPPSAPPMRPDPGPAVLDTVKARVNGELQKLLTATTPPNQMQGLFLAQAYHVSWTLAHHNERAVARVLAGLDNTFAVYRQNPKLAEADPTTPNPDWFGLGPSGGALALLAEPLKSELDRAIPDGKGGMVARRTAYAEMLVACRDWHRRHRRLYTNQTMINDLYGIYLANRGIAVVDPTQATPETAIRRYLYESVGLEPWRDSDPGGDTIPETGKRNWGVQPGYMQLTEKGLTRELGYVGSYGEVIDWVVQIYEATRPAPGEPGDPKILAQLIKIARARAPFRTPALDAEGHPAMRLESVVGWRDNHVPGDIVYGQRPSRDASALEAAAVTLDPHLVGYAQQMLADNQFFASLRGTMQENGLRVTTGLLGVPDQYDTIRAQSPSPHRLPMSHGQPDFVFTDEEDGVLALKRGDETLYVSLYWRARHAVNFLARVHYTTPTFDRIAVVRQETQFEPSGMFYSRPDWTNFSFGNGGMKYPGEHHSAHTGERLPIAKIPEGVAFKPGEESVYAGKGSFYTLRYGSYLIGMNLTRDRTYSLTVPASVTSVPELVSGKIVRPSGGTLSVSPMSTVVLYLES